MAAPQTNNASPRFVVQKAYGSEWARVIDTKTMRQVAKYSVLKFNGWEKAERRAAALNYRNRASESENGNGA